MASVAENSGKQRGRPFAPGQSGNPGGRPAVLAEVRALAAEHAPKAISTLAAIANNKDEDARARVAAASAILDRAVGKPVQATELSAGDGSKLEIIIRKESA